MGDSPSSNFSIENHGGRETQRTTIAAISGFPILTMASRKALFALPTRAIRSSRTTSSLLAPLQHHRAESTASSTSALAYKALHRRVYPLPTSDAPPSWSAQAAVSNILYETPSPSSAPPKRHILNCLVQNEPGVLSRVSGILAARGFNIDSLVVCNTEVEDLSRMTIVLSGQDGVVEQELLLAKINILGPEYFEELMAHHREITGGEEEVAEGEEWAQRNSESSDFHPSKLALSQALRLKHEHLKSITYF